MPRAKKPPATYIVQNPRGIPPGRHIIKFHACATDREDEDDHSGCNVQRWFEGEAFDPPEGFGLARFLEHQPRPGHICSDELHTDCAGPYLEVSDG